MPEFEESDHQPKPEHNYTPSTNAPKNKGGRRRSGGFKSEASASKSKIGEVDPAEALKADVQKDASRSDNTPDAETSRSIKNSRTSRSSSSSNDTEKSTAAKPQPSQATLDSIRKVEERIAKSLAESEKNRPNRGRHGFKKDDRRINKNGQKPVGGGLLSVVSQFFGKLFGSSPKNLSLANQRRSSRRRKFRNDNNQKDNSQNRSKSHRRGSKHRRKNTSQKT